MSQLPTPVGPKAETTDDTVNIVCGTQYLEQGSDGRWFDNRFPNMPSIAPFHGDASRKPCTSKDNIEDVAFGFPTGLTDGSPKWVVVLCDSITSEQETFIDRVFSGDWQGVQGVAAIELPSEFISTTILHEFLHFANPTDRQSTISCSLSRSLTHLAVPATLSNNEGEVYSFEEITSLPDNVKAENTESYVMLATGT
jgi:hypothetical protein